MEADSGSLSQLPVSVFVSKVSAGDVLDFFIFFRVFILFAADVQPGEFALLQKFMAESNS